MCDNIVVSSLYTPHFQKTPYAQHTNLIGGGVRKRKSMHAVYARLCLCIYEEHSREWTMRVWMNIHRDVVKRRRRRPSWRLEE